MEGTHDDITLVSLRLAKRVLEEELNELIAEKVAGFYDVTGVQVKGLDVQFKAVHHLGQREPEYLMCRAVADLHLPL